MVQHVRRTEVHFARAELPNKDFSMNLVAHIVFAEVAWVKRSVGILRSAR